MDEQRIVVDKKLVDNPLLLYAALKELYVGDEKSYHIYVRREHLDVLESVFDRVILENGWKNASFKYSLMNGFTQSEG